MRTLATSVCISFDGAGVTLALLFVTKNQKTIHCQGDDDDDS